MNREYKKGWVNFETYNQPRWQHQKNPYIRKQVYQDLAKQFADQHDIIRGKGPETSVAALEAEVRSMSYRDILKTATSDVAALAAKYKLAVYQVLKVLKARIQDGPE